MKQKVVSLKKINKIDIPLANQTKVRREKTQIIKIRNAKGKITTPWKSRESSETTLRNYILISLKIVKKWKDF
jgi:translation elongation factor EF-4